MDSPDRDIYITELADEELYIVPRSTAEETLEKIQKQIDQYQQDHIGIPTDMFAQILRKREPTSFDKRSVEVDPDRLDAVFMYLVLMAHYKVLQRREDGLVKCHIRYLKSFMHWGTDRVLEALGNLEKRGVIKYEIVEDVRKPNIKLLK